MGKKKKYKVELKLGGLFAYYVDRLLETGLYGATKEEVVREIFTRGLEGRLEKIGEAFEISRSEAEKMGYIPSRKKGK